jgi:hypothetical protein
MRVFVIDPGAVVHPKNLQDRTVLKDVVKFSRRDINVVKFEGTQLPQIQR